MHVVARWFHYYELRKRRTTHNAQGKMHTFFSCLLLATSRAATWTRFKSTNCYSGWGAKELDGGDDCGTMSVVECQAKCKELSDCKSITWDTATRKCFRRGYVSYINIQTRMHAWAKI